MISFGQWTVITDHFPALIACKLYCRASSKLFPIGLFHVERLLSAGVKSPGSRSARTMRSDHTSSRPFVDLTISDDDLRDEDFEDVAAASQPRPTIGAVDDSLDDFDDVDIDTNAYAALYEDMPHAESSSTTSSPGTSVQITLPSTAQSPVKKRTTTLTPRDRRNRVLVHQIHVLALLAAARVRNSWCNDTMLRNQLQDMVPDVLVQKLTSIHPRREPCRRERVRQFESFLTELVRWWSSRFRVDPRIAAAAAWRQPSTDIQQGRRLPPRTFVDGWITESAAERQGKRHTKVPGLALFPPGAVTQTPTYLRLLPPPERTFPKGLSAALRARLGSRETKAILFCALCRALGVPARFVVSIQVAPIAAAKAAAPSHARSTKHVDELSDAGSDEGQLYIEPLDEKTPPTVWVEAFSKPYQHWITVDPVRAFIKATGARNMEPIPAQRQNKLVYVVAFEEDGYARDVTARYTRTLYTRVARQRPSIRGRGDWWASVAAALHRPQKLDRDAVEDIELQDSARREPMPTSVGAFKDHPVYALERHLRRDEAIYPLHRVGTFQAQPVYLRANVVRLQSARQWYNIGREVVPGEAPLKWTKPRAYTTAIKRMEEQARASGDEPLEGLYAEFQTRVYVPRPVENGRVPRNAFNNIDLFVPSMLPAGGAHIAHVGAAKAARHVGVDFAEAVVGFDFRKFRSVPRLLGVVVPAEHASLVWETVMATAAAEAESEAAKVQRRALKNWGKLLTALTVARRVHEEYGMGEASEVAERPAEDEPQQLRDEERQLADVESDPPADAELQSSDAAQPLDVKPPALQSGRIVSLDELMAREDHEEDPPAPRTRRIVLRRRKNL